MGEMGRRLDCLPFNKLKVCTGPQRDDGSKVRGERRRQLESSTGSMSWNYRQCYLVGLVTLALGVSGSSSQLFVKSPHQQRASLPPVPNYSASAQVVSFFQPQSQSQHQQQHQQQQANQSSRRSQQMSPPTHWQHHHSPDYKASDVATHHGEQLEARGALSRNLYSRGARNGSLAAAAAAGANSALGSWHFPRISPEHAAEVLLTGAQVINRIAQAETPLNYCRTPDNQEGECSDIRKCIWLVLDKARLKQSVCLRNLIIPAVCCPLSSANNTPVANMIQSTLEPVLFRPKAPKQKKPAIGSSQTRPFTSIVSPAIVGSPPPSPASMVIRNPHQANVSSASHPATTAPATTTTTTTTTTAAATLEPANKPPASELGLGPATSGANNLFQDEPEPSSANSQQVFHGNANAQYNRTVSQKYPWANETCGESGRTRTGRIVGGSDSKLGQWPWMTAMYLNKRSAYSSGAGEFWCGGALINRRFILTAAHCLSDQRGNRYKNDQVTIKLGGVDLVRHQAPADILRNVDDTEARSFNFFPSLSSSSSPSSSSESTRGSKQRADRAHASNRSPLAAGDQSRSDADEEEEFSWTAFITKALGLSGPSSSTSSGAHSTSSSSSSSSTTSTTSQPTGDGGHANKALNSNQDKKQQLAAHAKRTYFREYKVANIKQHPKFQRHGFYNDIGLIELKSDVDYDDLISPVCLPTEHDLKRDLAGYVATVLGWGTLSYGGQGSKLLQQVAMPIWQNKDCDDRYLQHIGKTFLCAGFLTGGKDACQGDSGGPLMVSDNAGRWTLHGVVSFGKTCAQAGYPGVYTRVTEYLDWIRDNTELAGYQGRPADSLARSSPRSTTTTTTSGHNPISPANNAHPQQQIN